MSEEINEPTEQPEQQGAQLTINDLTAMKSIIDTASARGAFKPNEMMVVGQTYNKLIAFLEGVKQAGEAK
jgi:hypothetical protein